MEKKLEVIQMNFMQWGKLLVQVFGIALNSTTMTIDIFIAQKIVGALLNNLIIKLIKMIIFPI